MSWQTFSIRTPERIGFIDITRQIEGVVAAAGVREGTVVVFCPHTTAGITVNENADPDVLTDLKLVFDRLVPISPQFKHGEGNSDAHAKSTMVGVQVTLPVDGGGLALGTWQGVYFCEFDGPRHRTVKVRVCS